MLNSTLLILHLSSSANQQSLVSSTRLCCQIWNRTGHSALDCFHRMDYSFQGKRPPVQLAAMAVSASQLNTQQWYTDTGATNHITNDLQNRSISSDYHGTDKVAVGNGQGLDIHHTGSAIIQTPNSSFKLNRVLYVPDIASNLLSVNTVTKDNNFIFVFDSSGFSIQDNASGRILFWGTSENGLYPFPCYTTSSLEPKAFVGRISADIWHKRLGHPSSQIFQCIISSFQILFPGSCNSLSFCKFCCYGKART